MYYNDRMEFAELKKHIKARCPKPCYACYGDDDFLLSRAVALISGLVTGLAEFNIVEKEFQKAGELEEQLMQLPVMSEYRVVIARGKTDAAAIEEYLKRPNPSSVLVLTYPVPHDTWSRTSPIKLPAGAEGVNCNRLPIKLVVPFVRATGEKAGASFDDKAISALYSRCGGYMTRINSEAQKLAAMRAGGTVTEADVAAEVTADTEFVVFELGDSIIAGNTRRALEIVDGMAKNNDLTAAFTMLYNRFKRIFIAAVSPEELPSLGIKPFMATKLIAESKKLPKRKLKNILDMLCDADLGYKTGATSQYDALSAFVVRASDGGRI